MKNMKILLIIPCILIIAVSMLAGYFIGEKQVEVDNPLGSVSATNEYKATTTPENLTWTDQLIDTGYGSLGSVIITNAGDLQFNLLNATTTDVTKRTGNKATSTILIASFPASTAVGVYTFDAFYTEGLYLDVLTGSLGTSTITYR